MMAMSFWILRRFERLLLADLLLLDLPSPVEHVTLLLAQDARALVGNLLLLLGGCDRFVAIDLQDAEAGSRGCAGAPRARFPRSP